MELESSYFTWMFPSKRQSRSRSLSRSLTYFRLICFISPVQMELESFNFTRIFPSRKQSKSRSLSRSLTYFRIMLYMSSILVWYMGFIFWYFRYSKMFMLQILKYYDMCELRLLLANNGYLLVCACYNTCINYTT